MNWKAFLSGLASTLLVYAMVTPLLGLLEAKVASDYLVAGFLSANTIADIVLAFIILIIIFVVLLGVAKNHGEGKAGLKEQLFGLGTIVTGVVGTLAAGAIFFLVRPKVHELAYSISQLFD